MMRKYLTLLLALFALGAYGQIGYQVAVIDQTKGEPKKNTSVGVTVTISDNAGRTICSESRTVTTDNLGIVSLTIGNSETFATVDWSKLPLWVSATVDGVTISRTQVLSVPVAEYAKRSGALTREILCGKSWTHTDIAENGTNYSSTYTFYTDGTWKGKYGHGTYYISCDFVSLIYTSKDDAETLFYNANNGALIRGDIIYK